ncbi:hydrogenase maturation protein HypF [Bacillus tianshenii]|uniref:Carbamoyltransferase n=2 Tax=Sutcliffiella tianshenii TaxID=1463404 RepID=A0ABS2P3F8_9BACI|nr:hydrogenase maturation protein HypF [Bacillus tianshenii]
MVKGRVQGVGFRPFIYALSKKYKLHGTVHNNLDCVIIHVEGDSDNLNNMVGDLQKSPPKLAKINEIIIKEIPNGNFQDFTIISSQGSGSSIPRISADAAICDQCVEEMKDPQNRRYRYPFINCTQCGPRYTIVQALPYDRPNTTMKEFAMCGDCQKEYEDPGDRRHHAQPICCPVCGPTITLHNRDGIAVADDYDAITETVNLIKKGNIIAIKGIGGYHLACDANQAEAIHKIRLRKKRPHRPLGIMVKSLEVAKSLCHITKSEEEILTGPEMPIVVLQKKKGRLLPENLSPGLSTLGIMLPYTPLHHLLFENDMLDCLVMTSANPSGYPILYKSDCLEHIKDISDYLLNHNRNIYLPIDDSVVQFDRENMLYLRQGRGMVPDPIKTYFKVDEIIALGGNQKNTFAVGKQQHIVLSPHIGDLDNEEMIQSFQEQLQHFKAWLGVKGKYLAVDKHPLYATSYIGKESEGKLIAIQHHHAHHVSCMEDNGLKKPCLGIILDGTGYGEDGRIWGFEFLYGDAASFERLAHLQYTPLPGGEIAVKEPWRNAVGMLTFYWGQEGVELSRNLFPEKSSEISILSNLINNNLHTPMAGTCGRLFDSISAILGICTISTYEGEAAIKLSDYMLREPMDSSATTYPYHIKKNISDQLQVDFSPMIYQIVQERLNRQPLPTIIQKFHRTIVSCCVDTILRLMKMRPDLNKDVVLSGGSFQNVYLARNIQCSLQKEGFNVYIQRNVPCHDGGLSLGQIIIASQAIAQNKKGGDDFCASEYLQG